MTGESQVEEPRTAFEVRDDAIAAALAHADGWRGYRHARVGAFLGALTQAEHVVLPASAVNAAEDEARAAALTAAEEAVQAEFLTDATGLDEDQSYNNALETVLAAITALRQPQGATDTRGEPR